MLANDLPILGLEPDIEHEYLRVRALAPWCDDIIGAKCLSADDVLKAHFLIANHFYLKGSGLGGIGARDLGLLQSAIYRQATQFGGVAKWDSLFDIVATLFFGLIKNHPFYDANKRTAFLSALFQLYRHGYCPSVPEKEFEDFTVEIADGKLSNYARFNEMKKKGEADPEVHFIARYLRAKTRQIDTKDYSITFRDLQRIMNGFGYFLENPSGNRIDVVRYEERRSYVLFGSKRAHAVRLGKIGFPGWSTQVPKATLKDIRLLTGLTAERGYDSASFFRGLDPMQSLIVSYNEPLQRLAHR
jgi:death-on-curing protein